MLKEYNERSKKLGYSDGILDSDNAIMILSYWKGDYKNVIDLSVEAEK
ncbi:hypothetical protein [Chryseobacterium elymi]|nr:hypothetical protein [Chryseobacterium elymi]